VVDDAVVTLPLLVLPAFAGLFQMFAGVPMLLESLAHVPGISV
jgi:hypothetical protein